MNAQSVNMTHKVISTLAFLHKVWNLRHYRIKQNHQAKVQSRPTLLLPAKDHGIAFESSWRRRVERKHEKRRKCGFHLD